MTRQNRAPSPVRLVPDLPGERRQGATTMRDRDDALLSWLLLYPLQRVNDLAFVFERHRSSLSRQLTRLQDAGMVSSVSSSLEQAPSAWWVLTETGARYLMQQHPGEAERIYALWEWAEQERTRLQGRVSMLARLHAVLHGLIADLPRLFPEQEGASTLIRWTYQREVPLRVRDTSLFVDALLTWTCRADAETSSHALGVLIDPGFAGLPAWPLVQSMLEPWARAWAEKGNRQALPPVLVVVPTTHHQERWNGVLSHLATRSMGWVPPATVVVWPPEEPPRLPLSFWHQFVAHPFPVGIPAQWRSEKRTAQKEQEEWERDGKIIPSSRGQTGSSTQHRSSRRQQAVEHRHLWVLEELAAHPLMSLEELAVFVVLEKKTLRRYLTELAGSVEGVQTIVGQRWRLSARGRRFLAELWRGDDDSSRKAAEEVLQRAGHLTRQRVQTLAGLYTFFARLKEMAPRHGQTLLWWECGLLWHGTEIGQNVGDATSPCGRFDYQGETGKTLTAWIEWQAQPVSSAALTRQMMSYDAIWQASALPSRSMPTRLLFVASDSFQERVLWRVAPNHLSTTDLWLLTTTVALVQEQGPLASIWSPVWPNTVHPSVGMTRLKWQSISP
jgi:hypothetical protein